MNFLKLIILFLFLVSCRTSAELSANTYSHSDGLNGLSSANDAVAENSNISEWLSSLPICKNSPIKGPFEGDVGDKKLKWDNCVGTHTIEENSDFNGDTYTGEWQNGMPHGKGVLTFHGSAYSNVMLGSFEKGRMHGKILEYTFQPGEHYGDIYAGDYIYGYRNGYAAYFFNDGRVWSGKWNDEAYPDVGGWISGVQHERNQYNGSYAPKFIKPSVVYYKENNNQNNKKPDNLNEIIPVASGSGFIVSSKGHIVSNNHVIEGCREVKIHYKGSINKGIVLAVDTVNDLALIQSNFLPADVLSISINNPSLLEDIYVAGYPFGMSISNSVKVTRGIVSALSGIGNNFSNMQIDAALQPGNSGGPILNSKGNVIGVAVSKLDLKFTVEEFGVVPEGTNFGIKPTILSNFLGANGVVLIEPSYEEISKEQLTKKIINGTIFISCWMTYADLNSLKSKRVVFDSLLNK